MVREYFFIIQYISLLHCRHMVREYLYTSVSEGKVANDYFFQ